MKKTVKRILSIALSAVMLLGCVLPAFAVYSCKCGNSPLIVVSGMGAFPLVENAGTENERQVFAPDKDMILKFVKDIAGPVALFALNRDYAKLGDGIIPAVKELFEPLACKGDGSSKYNVSAYIYPESMDNYPEFINNKDFTVNEGAVVRAAADKIGADHVYFFNYDWRLDPMEHAKDLRKYVEKAKRETGHSKVSLAGLSMGGTIIASYLALYGSDDIDNFTMLSSAFTGTTIVSDLFNGKVEINKDGLIRILKELVGNEGVNFLFDALDKAGIFDILVNFADSLIYNLKGRVYDEVFQDTFITMPSMWDLIALEDYENAKDYLLSSDTDAALIYKADSYHYAVQTKLPQLFREAMENGTKVNIVSHYNMQGVPVTPSYKEQNDNVIDTKYTSGYAVCAYLDETLPEGYKQQNTVCADKTHNHISADRIIDASTCMLPEQTWFLKNLKHVGYMYNSQVMEFIMALCLGDEQYTVENMEPYSQFMDINPKNGDVSVIGATGGEELSETETLTEVTEPTENVPSESESETQTVEETTGDPETAAAETEASEYRNTSEFVEDSSVLNDDEQAGTVSDDCQQKAVTVGDSLIAIVPLGAACVALVLTAKRKRNKI